MNLPDPPIAQEGFFATHFFTVKGQEKPRDFYVCILGGKVIKAATSSWLIVGSFSTAEAALLPISPRSFSKHRRISIE